MKSTWVWEGGGVVLDHEKSKWLMSISWSHGLPVPLPTYVRPGDHEIRKWLMSILFCSRDDKTKSTWVWEGGRVLDH